MKKLKAWRKLKDRGFRFYDFNFTSYEERRGTGTANYLVDVDSASEIAKDLYLLFGGKDE